MFYQTVLYNYSIHYVRNFKNTGCEPLNLLKEPLVDHKHTIRKTLPICKKCLREHFRSHPSVSLLELVCVDVSVYV